MTDVFALFFISPEDARWGLDDNRAAFLVLKTHRRKNSVKNAQTLKCEGVHTERMAPAREFAFHGEFDISQKAQIAREFEPLRTGSPANTILDLTNVAYLDTTFLNAMVGLARWTAQNDANSRLCVAAGRNLSRIFHITALDKVFAVFATVALAREYASLSAVTLGDSGEQW